MAVTTIFLWRGGEDEFKALGNDPKKLPGMAQNYLYREGGDNTFMPETDDLQLPGRVGLHAIGGIVKHLSALTAVGCSTVNSYRRLWDTGLGACLRRLGFPKSDHWLACPRQAASNTAPWTRW